ncbi:MAG: hypothetical protein ACR2PK_01570 [Acidimicrobiales bacterium]
MRGLFPRRLFPDSSVRSALGTVARLFHIATTDIHNPVLWFLTNNMVNNANMDQTGMNRYQITLLGDETPHIVQADGYAQEGPLTTFFLCDSESIRLDSWATRLASFRSSDIRMVTCSESSGEYPNVALTLAASSG